MNALYFSEFGSSSVLHYGSTYIVALNIIINFIVLFNVEFPKPALKPGHAIVRIKAIGLNFADIYRRNGDYHISGAAPFVLGYEGR